MESRQAPRQLRLRRQFGHPASGAAFVWRRWAFPPCRSGSWQAS